MLTTGNRIAPTKDDRTSWCTSYLCTSWCISVYLCISLCISVYLCISLYISVYLCIYLYICLDWSGNRIAPTKDDRTPRDQSFLQPQMPGITTFKLSVTAQSKILKRVNSLFQCESFQLRFKPPGIKHQQRQKKICQTSLPPPESGSHSSLWSHIELRSPLLEMESKLKR